MAAGDPILASDYAGIRRGTIDKLMCRIRQSVVSSQAAGSAVTFDVEDWDPFSFHNTGANTSRITPTTPGYYRFNGTIYMAGTTGALAAWLRKNGVTAIPSGERDGGSPTSQVRSGSANAQVYCNGTTDYVEIMIDAAATVSTQVSAQFASYLECTFEGRVTNP